VGIKRYEDLEVWKIAHQAVLATYRITAKFPADERFGLVSQMRRAAVSMAANIVEGFGRRHPNDKVKFYNYSQSSTGELSYFFRLSKDLGYVKDSSGVDALLSSSGRMLQRLVQVTSGRLKARPPSDGSPPSPPQLPDSNC